MMYVFAFLDRANIGFAREAYQLDTGISDAAFALGAGLFFVGYAFLEVPSNLIMTRVGARFWMCRIMVTWGAISTAMAFAYTEWIFYTLRLLLGIAEAGFFPGVIYYLTQWFPGASRARVLGLFYFGAPLAFILGSPFSGLLLDLDGFSGVHGWQWMFIVTGLLTMLLGIVVLRYLCDSPRLASWLTEAEREALSTAVESEDRSKSSHGPRGALMALGNPRVLHLCLIYLLIQMSVYGVVFYLPSQVGALLGTQVGLTVGLVAAIPWLCAMFAAWWLPRAAGRSGRYREVAVLALVAAGLGIACSSAVASPVVALIALCLAAAGFIGVQPLFWHFPTAYLGGTAAAGGIALINSLGNLGGFIAPNARVWAEESFALSGAGLYLLSFTTLISAACLFALPQRPRPPRRGELVRADG
ncbi:MFS transporter [Halotalea alkalilenta]|uniref:MFS transporter n=1 Tax=Halotalea alkalilenta TaxID=376489 RepID=UPI001B7FF0FB|nr:MFS transporter [Halotalea alkalilenta]